MKRWLYLIPVLFILSCAFSNTKPRIPDGWKELDLKAFKITVPKNWDYVAPDGQEDSFAGNIEIAKSIFLSFDCSNMGYANHLLPTEQEYLKNKDQYQEFLPAIKTHNFLIDSNSTYIFKIIYPKVPGKGITGIYIHSRHSSFNFQMCANNLSLQNQELALQAFKTIIFPTK